MMTTGISGIDDVFDMNKNGRLNREREFWVDSQGYCRGVVD